MNERDTIISGWEEMTMNYIKGKGILIGAFSEDDLNKGNDRIAIERAKEQTGYSYTNTEYVKKSGKIAGMKIYVCSMEDFKI